MGIKNKMLITKRIELTSSRLYLTALQLIEVIVYMKFNPVYPLVKTTS